MTDKPRIASYTARPETLQEGSYLSRLNGQGGVSTYAINREKALAIEAAQEADLVRQRMEQEQRRRSMIPQAPPSSGMTIEQYLATTRGTDPRQPWVREAPPEPSTLGYIPGIGSLLQSLGLISPEPDAQLDRRLGQSAGGMALGNERVRQRLDDFERERIRARMMLPSTQRK